MSARRASHFGKGWPAYQYSSVFLDLGSNTRMLIMIHPPRSGASSTTCSYLLESYITLNPHTLCSCSSLDLDNHLTCTVSWTTTIGPHSCPQSWYRTVPHLSAQYSRFHFSRSLFLTPTCSFRSCTPPRSLHLQALRAWTTPTSPRPKPMISTPYLKSPSIHTLPMQTSPMTRLYAPPVSKNSYNLALT